MGVIEDRRGPRSTRPLISPSGALRTRRRARQDRQGQSERRAEAGAALNRNPANYIAETEQVAFCTSHVVPGIGFTNDSLLAARNFSYQDTQLTRLGGPNFNQIPINRPHVPVDDALRDGFGQMAVHQGVTPYLPNTLDEDRPLRAVAAEGGYVTVPTPVNGEKLGGCPASFDDHFSQARMFWLSLSSLEQDHVAEAYTFELGICYRQAVKERMLTNLARIDSSLCERVATGLGLAAPHGEVDADVVPSPLLFQLVTGPGPIPGRVVGVLAGPDADLAGINALRTALLAEGAQLRVIAAHSGTLGTGKNAQIVERTLLTTRSVEYDAVLVAKGSTGMQDPRLSLLLPEAFRHCKVLGAWGDGEQVLTDAGIDTTAPGIVLAAGTKAAVDSLAAELVAALGMHRVWDRAALLPTPV